MATYSSVILGHISYDQNIDHEGHLQEMLGGAVLYSSASAFALGHNVLAVTKLALKDKERLKAFTLPPENILVKDSKTSTMIRNQYLSADKEKRICTCLELGEPFTAADLPDADAALWHFAGLIYGDFDGDMIKAAAKKGDTAVDVQGFLRHADMAHGGNMFFEDWMEKKELLPYITYLKTDAAEAEIMTGLTDRREAAKLLYSWGAKEILITHNTEVLAYDGKDFYTCPIKSRNLSGRTGRGDTTFAAYINERLNNGIEQSLQMATATVSLKMETPGPFRGSKSDVEAYIRRFYR